VCYSVSRVGREREDGISIGACTRVPVLSKVRYARLIIAATTSGVDLSTSLIEGVCSVKVWRHDTIEVVSAGCVACMMVILSWMKVATSPFVAPRRSCTSCGECQGPGCCVCQRGLLSVQCVWRCL
jgi:hypothetical protein